MNNTVAFTHIGDEGMECGVYVRDLPNKYLELAHMVLNYQSGELKDWEGIVAKAKEVLDQP